MLVWLRRCSSALFLWPTVPHLLLWEASHILQVQTSPPSSEAFQPPLLSTIKFTILYNDVQLSVIRIRHPLPSSRKGICVGWKSCIILALFIAVATSLPYREYSVNRDWSPDWWKRKKRVFPVWLEWGQYGSAVRWSYNLSPHLQYSEREYNY